MRSLHSPLHLLLLLVGCVDFAASTTISANVDDTLKKEIAALLNDDPNKRKKVVPVHERFGHSVWIKLFTKGPNDKGDTNEHAMVGVAYHDDEFLFGKVNPNDMCAKFASSRDVVPRCKDFFLLHKDFTDISYGQLDAKQFNFCEQKNSKSRYYGKHVGFVDAGGDSKYKAFAYRHMVESGSKKVDTFKPVEIGTWYTDLKEGYVAVDNEYIKITEKMLNQKDVNRNFKYQQKFFWLCARRKEWQRNRDAA